MKNTLADAPPAAHNQAVVAIYRNHSDAESATRKLAARGISIATISIIGRNFETHEDVVGFYRPADAALSGAGQGAWLGGIFGLMAGAMGFFVFPMLGALTVLGPLSGMIAGAVGGAGVGALVNGLVVSGIPRDQALKYQERLEAGEFLVVVHGGAGDAMRAQAILEDTGQIRLKTHNSIT